MKKLTIAAMIALMFLGAGSLLQIVFRGTISVPLCLGVGMDFGAGNVLSVYLIVALFREIGWPWRGFLCFLPIYIIAEMILTCFIYLKAPHCHPAIWTGVGALIGTLIPLAGEWLFGQHGKNG